MRQELYIEYNRAMTRAALVEDGALVEYCVESDNRERLMGNIYKGRVQNVLKGMQAAFVDIGIEKNAFLYLGSQEMVGRDIEVAEGETPPEPQPLKVRLGQELIVQVIKEMEGNKGPRITTQITLPGRLTVYAPTLHMLGVSRRIEPEAERTRLREAMQAVRPKNMGVIVRTAAEGATGEEMLEDIEMLREEWDYVQQQAASLSAPCLLRREEPLHLRAIRDMVTQETDSIHIADKEQFEQASALLTKLSPELSDRIHHFEGPGLLFDVAGIQEATEKVLERKVWLNCGGYLVVDHTEAMTVIDVNTGKFVGSTNLQDTVFKTNMEAVQEIARQLRLRDIGGIIIIDFIDMEDPLRRHELIGALQEALRRDRNKTNVVGLTGLGMLEMTRKKMRRRLSAQLAHTCPCCQGTGQVMSDEFIARKALRDVDRIRGGGYIGGLILQANTGVCQRIEALDACEGVSIRPTPYLRVEEYHIHHVMENDTDR